MSKKVWNLLYVAGNPALFTRITKDATSPLSRAEALTAAEKVAANGWRVWVEHVERTERIFESYHEIAYQSGQAPGAAPDSSSQGIDFNAAPAPTFDLQVQLQQAAVRWWENHRPLSFTYAQHLENPAINTSSGPQKDLAIAVAAFLKSAIS